MQVLKDVTLTYVGYNSTAPSTKLALTSFQNAKTYAILLLLTISFY